MAYTPRQISALCEIAQDRKRRDMAQQLWLNALAAQSVSKEGVKAIREQLKKWDA
jgi:hypothetical protein